MFLSRFEFLLSSLATLAGFGVAVMTALAGGVDPAFWFAAGALWFWALTSWARVYRERRRGWRVRVREDDNGLAVGLWVRGGGDDNDGDPT